MTAQKSKPKISRDYLGEYFTLFNRVLDTELAKKVNLRKFTERWVYLGTKNGVKTADKVTKMYKNVSGPERQKLEPVSNTDLFDLNYNEEQLMIQETLRAFADQMRMQAEKIDGEGIIPQSLLDEYNSMQLAYMQIPESLGGLMKDRATITQMLMAETLAYGDLGQAVALYTTHSVVNALVRWGSAAQQQELIPKFLSDSPKKATMALQEPQPLFNPYSLQTTATKRDNDYVVNGTKSMVPMAQYAEFFIVSAQTQNDKNIVLLIDANTSGVNISEEKYMGLKAAGLCTIEFDNVVVDKSAVLSDADFNYEEFVNYGKLGWCAMAVGCCQAVLDYVITYANDRHAFGEPISNRQAVAFMIADIKIEVDSMRMLTQRAAARAEQGKDFGREAYLAHILCGDKAMQIGSNGVQLLGGHGYIKDFPVERWYRDLRAVALAPNGMHL
jgi:alkylation response protein AidB-like acyl-CoA dehydrogenase